MSNAHEVKKLDDCEYQKLALAIVPMATTTFAIAFNVGYFSALDISWFTLFSVSDHVVFSVRALPVAVGASVLLGIGYKFAIKPPAWLDDIISYSWIRRLLKGCFPHLLPTKLLGMCTAWIVFCLF